MFSRAKLRSSPQCPDAIWENIKRGGVCLQVFFWPGFAKENFKKSTLHGDASISVCTQSVWTQAVPSSFVNKNNWKLVLIITFRNQRMRKFCKKRRLQLDQIFTIQAKDLLNSIKKRCFSLFFPGAKPQNSPEYARNLLYLLVFLTFRMKNVHYSCSTPPDGVPLVFNLLFLERIEC